MTINEVHSPKGRFGPLQPDDLSVGVLCIGCGEPMEVGDIPSLVNGWPADEHELSKAQRDLPHLLEAQLAHERCAYPPAIDAETRTQLERIVSLRTRYGTHWPMCYLEHYGCAIAYLLRVVDSLEEP